MSKILLQEYIVPSRACTLVESADDAHGKKNLYMKGVFIEGGVRNANQRVYPITEIQSAVDSMNGIIKEHGGICGEVDHPDDLKINLDRVSHMIEQMWMDGPAGHGKLKILPTPMGELVKAMLSSGVKLGVSSRGSGNVNEGSGHVSDFEIVTVDIVAQPSAPHAFPKAIYESLLNYNGGSKIFGLAAEASQDQKVQRYLKEAITGFIKELKK